MAFSPKKAPLGPAVARQRHHCPRVHQVAEQAQGDQHRWSHSPLVNTLRTATIIPRDLLPSSPDPDSHVNGPAHIDLHLPPLIYTAPPSYTRAPLRLHGSFANFHRYDTLHFSPLPKLVPVVHIYVLALHLLTRPIFTSVAHSPHLWPTFTYLGHIYIDMWPIFTCVTHIYKCGQYVHLWSIFTPVARLCTCGPSLHVWPIFTPVAHLYTFGQSLHLWPIFTPVAHLYTVPLQLLQHSCIGLYVGPEFTPVKHVLVDTWMLTASLQTLNVSDDVKWT